MSESIREWADRTFVRVTWQDRLERIPNDYGRPNIVNNQMPTEEEREEALAYRLTHDNVPY